MANGKPKERLSETSLKFILDYQKEWPHTVMKASLIVSKHIGLHSFHKLLLN